MTASTRQISPWKKLRARYSRHRQLVWQGVVILGVLLFSAAFSFVLPEKIHLFLILLPIGVLGVMILLRWPPLGLILFIAVNLSLRINVPLVGLAAAMLMGLTGLWIVDMVIRKRAIMLVPSPTILPLLFFLAIAVFSFVLGQLPWFPTAHAPIDAQIGGLFIFILSFSAFLLAAHQIRDIRWLKWMTFLFIAHGSVAGFVGVLFGGRLNNRLFNGSVLGGSLFWTWLVAMTLSQSLFNRQLSRKWRIALGVAVVVILYLRAFKGRGWSSGWIPAFVAIGVIIAVGAPRITAILSIIGGIVLAFGYQFLYGFVMVGDNEYSAQTRLAAWRIAGEIIKVNPLLGLGPANYYYYTPLFNILGWNVNFNSHNNYVDIVAQTGFLGLACFIWFVFVVGRMGWRLRRHVPSGSFEQAFVYGALGGLAATVVSGMLGDWVLPFVYNIGLNGMRSSTLAWIFLGGLLALDQIVRRRVLGDAEVS